MLAGAGREGASRGRRWKRRLELLHDDYAYEFQIGWNLWELEDRAGASTPRWARESKAGAGDGVSGRCSTRAHTSRMGTSASTSASDAPFLEEDADLDEVGARHVEENVRQLVELTAGVEKASGATARLLWSELGESLAQRLAARLGMEN